MSYYRRKYYRRYFRRYWRRYKKKYKNKFNMNYYNYVCNIQTRLFPSKRTFNNADEFNYKFEMSETPFLNFNDILMSAKGYQNFKNVFQYFKIRAYSLKIIPDINNGKDTAMNGHNLPIINYSNTYSYAENAAHYNVPNRSNTKDSNYAILCKPTETTYKYHYLRGQAGVWFNIKVTEAQLLQPYTYGTLYVTTFEDPTDTTVAHYPNFIVELKLYVTLKCVDV